MFECNPCTWLLISNAIRMFMGKCITDVHWFVVVQCYTWRFICYTSSIICCCNGLSLPIVWLSARSGCCFPSYLHLTLSVFHQLIIPLRYLTIKFRNQSLFPLLCIVRAVSSPRSIYLHHPFSNLVVSSIIIILSSGIYFGCSGSHHGRFMGACCGGCFLHFQFCSRHAYDRANTPSSIWFIRPLTFILHYFIEPVGVQHYYHWSSNRSSIVGV